MHCAALIGLCWMRPISTRLILRWIRSIRPTAFNANGHSVYAPDFLDRYFKAQAARKATTDDAPFISCLLDRSPCDARISAIHEEEAAALLTPQVNITALTYV
jgi:hypothetical protein